MTSSVFIMAGGVFLFLRITLVDFIMDLLIAVPVIAGACLLGSFLGKAFVAIIQKFSND